MEKIINFNDHVPGWCALTVDVGNSRTMILAVDDETGELIMVKKKGHPRDIFSSFINPDGRLDHSMVILDANGPEWEHLHLDAFISGKTKKLLLEDDEHGKG